ncbi:MAG: nitroreductase family protein, partial [Clostridia bacterium]|nr:nitroreductase family protein [Clostridia bacterium]
NMMLQAAEGGIGSCFVWFAGTAIDKDAELKSALSIPEDFHPMFSIVFGYAKENVPEKTLTEMKIECNYV